MVLEDVTGIPPNAQKSSFGKEVMSVTFLEESDGEKSDGTICGTPGQDHNPDDLFDDLIDWEGGEGEPIDESDGRNTVEQTDNQLRPASPAAVSHKHILLPARSRESAPTPESPRKHCRPIGPSPDSSLPKSKQQKTFHVQLDDPDHDPRNLIREGLLKQQRMLAEVERRKDEVKQSEKLFLAPFRKEYNITPQYERIMTFKPEINTHYPLPPNYLDKREHNIQAFSKLEAKYVHQLVNGSVPTNDSLKSDWKLVAIVDLSSFTIAGEKFNPMDEKCLRIGAVIKESMKRDEGVDWGVWDEDDDGAEGEGEGGNEAMDEDVDLWGYEHLFEEEERMLGRYYSYGNPRSDFDHRGQSFETRRNERRRNRGL